MTKASTATRSATRPSLPGSSDALFVVSSGIPIPEIVGRGRPGEFKYPALKVGESYAFPAKVKKNIRTIYVKRSQKVTVRAINKDTARVWRIG